MIWLSKQHQQRARGDFDMVYLSDSIRFTSLKRYTNANKLLVRVCCIDYAFEFGFGYLLCEYEMRC